jgi:hypothetical protein
MLDSISNAFFFFFNLVIVISLSFLLFLARCIILYTFCVLRGAFTLLMVIINYLLKPFFFFCHLQVESMKKKLPWLKYDMKKAEYMEAKEQEKDAKKKLDEAAKTLNDLREPIEYDDLVLPNCAILTVYAIIFYFSKLSTVSYMLMTCFIICGH